MRYIELKEITLDRNYQFIESNYPAWGIYEVTDSGGNKTIVAVFNGFVTFLHSEIETVDYEKPKGVSEDFALKMLAVANGKVKDLEL